MALYDDLFKALGDHVPGDTQQEKAEAIGLKSGADWRGKSRRENKSLTFLLDVLRAAGKTVELHSDGTWRIKDDPPA